MRYLYTGKEAGEIDAHAINIVRMPSPVLMERAALSVCEAVERDADRSMQIVSVCGTGNNAGDAVGTARLLYEKGFDVTIALCGNSERMTGDTKRQLEIAENCDVPVYRAGDVSLDEYDIIIDGLFGIGLSREITGEYAAVIGRINSSGARVYAVDIPSGVSADTGKVMGCAVKADVTVTFGVEKLGLVLFPGREFAGEVFICDIGFPKQSTESVYPLHYGYETGDVGDLLPERPMRSNKGTFGKVLVIAGCETMCGAACLCAEAALRMGAGLVKVLTVKENRNVLFSRRPELLFAEFDELESSVEWADSIVMGPGMGLSERAGEIVRYVVENSPVPTVIDGDAIRLSAGFTKKLSDNFIVTPHVKEMTYLTDLMVKEIKNDMVETTIKTAEMFDCIIVNKDAVSFVSDGNECYVNLSGNNGMATGGSGDVLSGIIGGLLGQGMDPFEAAKLADYIHGLAGDAAAKKLGKYSLLATDILEGISEVLNAADR